MSQSVLALLTHTIPFTLMTLIVALVKLRDLFKTPSKSSVKITSLQLPAGNNYRDLLRSVKDRNEKKIVVDCSVEILYHVLKQVTHHHTVWWLSPTSFLLHALVEYHLPLFSSWLGSASWHDDGIISLCCYKSCKYTWIWMMNCGQLLGGPVFSPIPWGVYL